MSAACRYTSALLLCSTVFLEAAGAPSGSRSVGYRFREVTPIGTGKVGFTLLSPNVTGVTFTNELRGDSLLTNSVAHNGSGLAIGDVDGDGWQDVYLCGLQNPNRLFRNLGDWRFKEQPLGEAACPNQFSTGATLADVDGDQDLDLLVNGIAAGTRLFLNDGHAHWTEVTGSGLSTNASATSLTLADIDGDGDLDLYCTHFIDYAHLADPTTRFSVARKGDRWEVTKVNGESTRSPKWKDRFEALPDGMVRELPEVHALYRNDGHGHFTAIQFEPGIFSDEHGKPIPPFRDWGLAAMFRDLNGDGIPDLYVCNDNTSPDRIWINSGKGTFRALETAKLRHTSRSSMGVDFADLDRDGHDDFIVVDMLSRQHERRMTQLARERSNPLDTERAEERPQYNRNTLFFGRQDGFFVEAAFMAGVAATDWTWTPIFTDVDLDGYEDLLVTNGFEFDVMDQDSRNEIKDPQRRKNPDELKRSMGLHPHFHTRNEAFHNQRDGTFKPMGAEWGFDLLAISYGMAQGDLDNDGDLDLVVNNLNENLSVYRNNAPAGRIAVQLKGAPGNTEGVGARVSLVGGALTQSQEILCGGRYLSSDQAIRVFAVDPDATKPMRLEIRWRNGTRSTVTNLGANRVYEVDESAAPSQPSAPPPSGSTPLFADVSPLINHVHHDATIDDWASQPMLPHRLSKLGPGLAWYDVDGDGWEDLIVAAGRGGQLAVYHNNEGRSFTSLSEVPANAAGQGAVVGWANGRGERHVIVGGMQPEAASDAHSELSLYSLTNLAAPKQLPVGPSNPGPIATADIDGDGDLDMFVGGRFRPGHFPEAAASSIWMNQEGRLARSDAASEPFKALGLVSGATFADFDGDGSPELALALQWGPVRVFHNHQGRWEDKTAEWGLAGLSGWWTSVTAGDFDGDGRLDLAAGNWGRNSVYELYQPLALRLFYGDWVGDGGTQMLEAWRSGERWLPVHDRTWLARGLPSVAAQFPTHQSFGQAGVREILGTAFDKCRHLDAGELRSMVFLNRGRQFEAIPLPREAQLAPVFSANPGDVDADGSEDLFLSQNFFGTASDISRDDGGRGLWLRGLGDGHFQALDGSLTGIKVLGEQRGAGLADFNQDGRVDVAITQNNGPTKLYTNQSPKRGLHVILRGSAKNPDAVGARLRVIYADGRKGPCRLVQAGSGYWSQDTLQPVLGFQAAPTSLWVRWPGGQERTYPIPLQDAVLRIDTPDEKP